jgi:hypothetical protein
VRCAELRHRLRDEAATRHLVIRIAAQWLHQQGDTGGLFDDHLAHDLVEVRPMGTTVALGEVNDLFGWGLGTIVAAIHMETRSVEMSKLCGQAQALGGLCCHAAVEGGDARAIERLQGAPEHISIEMSGCNAWSNEPRGGFVVKKTRNQVALLIHKAQPMKNHRFDRLAEGDGALSGLLGHGAVNDCPDPQFLIHRGYQAEMIQ